MAQPFKTQSDLGGLRTDAPADKIPSRNASGIKNIDFSSRGLIQTRAGYDIYGNDTTEAGNGVRGYLYKKNFGTLKRIKLRVRDNDTNTNLEWHNPSNPATSDGKWETFVPTLTTGKVMGFTPFNQSNENVLVFGDSVMNYSTWNGATGLVASVTANTIVISETIAREGFSTTTGSLIVDGTEYAYTSTAASTFSGVTPDPTTQAPVAKSGVIQLPDTTTHSTLPKGNIFLTSAARVWIAGIPFQESQLLYSKVGDETDFSAGTSPEEAGIEDFPDGGGAITLLDSKENQKIIIHKEDGIMQFRLDYTATAKIPYLDTFTLADDSGATNQKAGAGLNSVSYFTTGVEGIKSLARALDGDELNLDSLTDGVLPTIKNYDFDNAATVYYPSKRAIFVGCKSSSSENVNNKVIALYINRGNDGTLIGDISIDDDYVADWIVDGKDLYKVSSVDQNVYKMFGRRSNNGAKQFHEWTSKEFTFEDPTEMKEFNTLYVDGLIGDGTKIKVSIIYGQYGVQSAKSKTLSWQDEYVNSVKVNALGDEVLGSNSLGESDTEISDSYSFSVPIHFDPELNERYKIKIETVYDDDTNNEAFWAVSNIATNPTKKGVRLNNMINSNN